MVENVRSFQDLRTWKEAHALTLEIYRITNIWPPDERFGLISQIRRSSSSVPTNIAEGMGRGSAKDLVRFIIVARGSVQEVIYQLMLAHDLRYLSDVDYQTLAKRFNGLAIGMNAHITELQRHILK